MTETPSIKYCQNCLHCTPKAPSFGLHCGHPEVGENPQPIFWAILKFCGEDRAHWKAENA